MTGQQTTMFATAPSGAVSTLALLSRKTDSDGSKAAARKMVKTGALSKQRAEVLDALKRYLREHNYERLPTSKELASWADMDRHLVGRRLPEVARKVKRLGEQARWTVL